MNLPSRVGMIFAQSLNKVIGRDNQIPSEFPSDLAYFKEKTLNSTVIMGRKTWESLPRKPLPGRKNVVLTSQKNYPVPEGVEVISDIEDLEVTTPLLMFIGGTSVYELAKRYVNEIYVTYNLVFAQGDVYAPNLQDLLSSPNWYLDSENREIKDGVSVIYRTYKKGIPSCLMHCQV